MPFDVFPVVSRIEQVQSAIGAMQTQVRSQFKVALLQLPRSVRSLKAEDFFLSETHTDDLTIECAKVAYSVSSSVSNEVSSTVKAFKEPKKANGRRNTKKSSILAEGPPMTAARKSSRKRAVNSWVGDTPLASSTLTSAALGGFSTVKHTKTRGRTIKNNLGASSDFPAVITPKFDPATPLIKTAVRSKKSDERFLVSMNGSPVYVGGKGSRTSKEENFIPLPIGDGQTLVVPADNPEVQPLIQKLINSCLSMVNKR